MADAVRRAFAEGLEAPSVDWFPAPHPSAEGHGMVAHARLERAVREGLERVIRPAAETLLADRG